MKRQGTIAAIVLVGFAVLNVGLVRGDLISGITASASSDQYSKVQQLVYYGEDSSKYDAENNQVFSTLDQWNTDNGVAKEDTWVKFDLGDMYSGIEIDVFNYASGGDASGRRFVTADIWYATSAPTVDNPTDSSPGNWTKFANDYAFSEANPYDPTAEHPYTTPTSLSLTDVSARYVLFNDIVNGGSTPWGNGYGLNTVAFSGVPEPSSMVLLSAGLLGLLAYAWRKRR